MASTGGSSNRDQKDSSERDKAANPIDRRTTVKVSDMPEDLQQKAIEFINAALDKFKDATTSQEREVAKHVKQEFDKLPGIGPTWHCVFGRNFAAHCTYQSRCFLYLTIGQHNLVLWKHT
eukprot:RCo016664